MANIERHYKCFEWILLNRDHLDHVKTNENYYKIVRKADYITENYPITLPELASDLFIRYIETAAAEKFDPTKGNIFTWIKQWINLELNNYIRKLKGLDSRTERNMLRESDTDQLNEDSGEDFMADLFIEPNTPEDLVSNAQQMALLKQHLSETEIAFLNGDLLPQEAVKKSGLSLNTFKRLINQKLNKLRGI